MANTVAESGNSILAQLGIDPHNLRADFPIREQRLQYRAIVQWLKDYKPEPNATNLDKVKGHLEALHHGSNISDFNLIKSILKLPVLRTQNIDDLFLPLYEYLIRNDLKTSFLLCIEEIISSLRKKSINIDCIFILKARLVESFNKLEACNILKEIVKTNSEESIDSLEAHIRLSAIQMSAATYKEGLASVKRSLQMIKKLTEFDSKEADTSKLSEFKSDSLEILAYYKMNHGFYHEAISLYNQSLNIIEKNYLTYKLMSPLVHLGVLYRRVADYERAIDYLNKAKVVAEKLEDDNAMAWVAHHLAWILMKQGKFRQAKKQSHISLEIYKKMEAQAGNSGISDVYEQLGLIHIAEGKFDIAYKELEGALKIRKNIGKRHGAASCLKGLAIVEWHKKRYLSFFFFFIRSFYEYSKIGVLNKVRFLEMFNFFYVWTVKQ